MPLLSTRVRIDLDDSYEDFMGGYLAVPEVETRGGLIVLQEIFGVTDAMRAIAIDFANQGYLTLVPDIFWRIERNLELGNGEDPVQRQRAVDVTARFDEALGTTDIARSMDWLVEWGGLRQRPAVLGFCLGGRLAVQVSAVAEPPCAVSMYGVKLNSLATEIGRTPCPLQFHFGENDNHNPMPTILEVKQLVEQRERSSDEFYTYPAAEHAFYNRFRTDRFDEASHQLARARVLEFLERHVPPPQY
ncbi:dienelactone hydrolase family protein [Bosea sp. NPDC003192]|uniref:dienelactone hydrolase family protein n=1 Tax=Bosea sp. NPDC003192 TaxID=3390551 RepID=UPI003D0165B8